MNRLELIKQLAELERRGIFVLLKRDIDKLFSNEDDKTRQKSLQRMVNAGLLKRAAKGVYVNPAAASRHAGWVIEELAKALRPGQLSYVSLESILSEYGIISQIPMSRLTVMTTGASGVHETPYGVIEFTHTKRSVPDILRRTIHVGERPLRIANEPAAIQDLLRVGRNTDMIDFEALTPKGKS